MKITRLFAFSLITLCLSFSVQAQDVYNYDTEMRKLAVDVANQVRSKKKLNIAVWYFKDSFRKKTVLGDYIGQEFSIYFTNASEGFDVMDRDAIEQVLEEHNLNYEEGIFDPSTLKEINKYIQADAIITGTVDVTSMQSLKIRLKLIDIETGRVLSAIPRNIPKDENIKYILDETGINQNKEIDKGKLRLNRGERYGSSEYIDPQCEEKNVGDYCFENDTEYSYNVVLNMGGQFNYKNQQSIWLAPGHSSCFLDLPIGRYSYRLIPTLAGGQTTVTTTNIQGILRAERCKSIIYNISYLQPQDNSIKTNRSIGGRKKDERVKRKISIDDVQDIIEIVKPIFKKKKNNL